jgi:hypothetical protein
MIGHLINHVKQDLTYNVKLDILKIYDNILLIKIKNIEKKEDNLLKYLKGFSISNKRTIEYYGNGIFYSASASKYNYNHGLRFGRYSIESGKTIDTFNFTVPV